jgi:hypothetical protein
MMGRTQAWASLWAGIGSSSAHTYFTRLAIAGEEHHFGRVAALILSQVDAAAADLALSVTISRVPDSLIPWQTSVRNWAKKHGDVPIPTVDLAIRQLCPRARTSYLAILVAQVAIQHGTKLTWHSLKVTSQNLLTDLEDDDLPELASLHACSLLLTAQLTEAFAEPQALALPTRWCQVPIPVESRNFHGEAASSIALRRSE